MLEGNRHAIVIGINRYADNSIEELSHSFFSCGSLSNFSRRSVLSGHNSGGFTRDLSGHVWFVDRAIPWGRRCSRTRIQRLKDPV